MAEGDVLPGPVEQHGEAHLIACGVAAYGDGAALLGGVLALGDEVVALGEEGRGLVVSLEVYWHWVMRWSP